jgi:hypothetical protein
MSNFFLNHKCDNGANFGVIFVNWKIVKILTAHPGYDRIMKYLNMLFQAHFRFRLLTSRLNIVAYILVAKQ